MEAESSDQILDEILKTISHMAASSSSYTIKIQGAIIPDDNFN